MVFSRLGSLIFIYDRQPYLTPPWRHSTFLPFYFLRWDEIQCSTTATTMAMTLSTKDYRDRVIESHWRVDLLYEDQGEGVT